MNLRVTLTDAELTEAVSDWLRKKGYKGEWSITLGVENVGDALDRFITAKAKITAEQQ